MLKISTFFAILGFVASSYAQMLPANEIPPTWERKDGNWDSFNYNLTLKPLTNEGLTLDQMTEHPIFIYYYSATCPACRNSYPKVQELANEFSDKGLQVIGICVRGNTPRDLAAFNRDMKVQIPLFQDIEGQFGNAYGVGHVPMGLLVNPKTGHYMRIANLHRHWGHLLEQVHKLVH
jgi:peroxiredoxin